MPGNQKPDSKNNAASTRSSNTYSSQTPEVALLRDLREAMSGKYVKMGPQEFLDKFVEAPIGKNEPGWKNVFNEVPNGANEAELCKFVLKEINRRTICPGHKVIGTPHKADPHDDWRQKVDGGLYPRKRAPSGNRNSWADQLVSFEWKRENVSDDPFDDSSAEFEATSERRQKNRGQLISYASEVLLCQHRCFHYTVVIFGVYARIIRWDRSGAIVTKKFDYTTKPRYLCQFLWRFCQLSPEKQGLDPTAVRIDEGSDDWALMDKVAANKPDELKALEEARLKKTTNDSKRGTSNKPKETPQEEQQETRQEKEAWLDAQHTDFARQCFEESLMSDWPRWRLTVCDEPAEALGVDTSNGSASSSSANPAGKASHDFLVCQPYFNEPGVVGRGTRGYIAVDCETEELVFLKDAWRIDLDGIKREGDILEHLASKGVRNIPTVLCHGDVRGQCTMTYKFRDQEAAHPIKKHAHYRLVEKEIGCPLNDFENGYHLLKVLLDCLYAHRDAVEKANILHRDISAGNILIIYAKNAREELIPYGLLNDWELSRELSQPSLDMDRLGQSNARQPDLMGTWQFRSVASLNYAEKQMAIQDDLESFLYVLLYFALRFLPNNHPDIPHLMTNFFDGAYDAQGVCRCGPIKKLAIRTGTIDWEETDGITNSLQIQYVSNGAAAQHPLDMIISTLFEWFQAYYRLIEKPAKKATAPYTVQGGVEPEDLWVIEKTAEAENFESVTKSISAPTDQDAELAAKLSSHRAICKLFERIGRAYSWPTDDKTSDQLLGPTDNQVLPTVPMEDHNAEGSDQARAGDSRRLQGTSEPTQSGSRSEPEAQEVQRLVGDKVLRPRPKRRDMRLH
ncbi:hypothetical protein B0H21DRAFT_883107 [Amylocystis lapponica]|nr:hypothetical protein B0H21DRAFT_883107 [Amylocystis lapponica]